MTANGIRAECRIALRCGVSLLHIDARFPPFINANLRALHSGPCCSTRSPRELPSATGHVGVYSRTCQAPGPQGDAPGMHRHDIAPRESARNAPAQTSGWTVVRYIYILIMMTDDVGTKSVTPHYVRLYWASCTAILRQMKNQHTGEKRERERERSMTIFGSDYYESDVQHE